MKKTVEHRGSQLARLGDADEPCFEREDVRDTWYLEPEVKERPVFEGDCRKQAMKLIKDRCPHTVVEEEWSSDWTSQLHDMSVKKIKFHLRWISDTRKIAWNVCGRETDGALFLQFAYLRLIRAILARTEGSFAH